MDEGHLDESSLCAGIFIWDGGVIFEGTKGKMMGDCYGANPRLLPTKLMKEVKLPPQTLPRVPEGHYLQWANACMNGFGKSVTSSNFDYAGPFTESILMGNLAIRSYMLRKQVGDDMEFYGRKKLLWDGENMKIRSFMVLSMVLSVLAVTQSQLDTLLKKAESTAASQNTNSDKA